MYLCAYNLLNVITEVALLDSITAPRADLHFTVFPLRYPTHLHSNPYTEAARQKVQTCNLPKVWAPINATCVHMYACVQVPMHACVRIEGLLQQDQLLFMSGHLVFRREPKLLEWRRLLLRVEANDWRYL